MRELWDVYGENFQKIPGRIAVRGKHDLGMNEYHLVVYAWIFAFDGRVLISRRQKGRSFGGAWECPAGCAKQGESSQDAVLREVEEELGVRLDPAAGELFCRYKRRFPMGAKAICDVWVFKHPLCREELVLQKEEVCDVQIISPAELLSMQRAGAFRRRYPYMEEMIARHS